MSRVILLALSLLWLSSVYTQSLTGNWVGEVMVTDNTSASTLELFLEQEGDFITGISLYTNMQTGEYVEKTLSGQVNGNSIVLKEQKILGSFLLPSRGLNTGWFLKELRGTVQRDEHGSYTGINGTLSSSRLINNFSAQTSLGPYYLPRRFALNREDTTTIKDKK